MLLTGSTINFSSMSHVERKLSFQQAICYLSFRWVNLLHAWTVNSGNRLGEKAHDRNHLFLQAKHLYTHHKQVVWHLWCRWVKLAFLTTYLLVMLTWNWDSFVEMAISIYETIFASSDDLILLLHLLHLALVLLRHHTLIVQDFTFRANSKLIPARSTMQLTTFNHTLSLPPTGTQMAPEIFDSMIQGWPLLLILMVPTHKMTP